MRKNFFLIVLVMVFTMNAMAQNIPSYVPKDGLVAWYPFNGNANDESGNGNNLHQDTNYIYPTPTKDRFGNSNSAYNFNSDKCSLTKKTPNTNGIEFTWSLWLKKNNNEAESFLGLGESNPTSTSGGGFDCYQNKPQFICQGINTNVTNSSYTIKMDEWYFFTITKDKNNTFKIYINGILNSSGSSTYLGYNSTTKLYVNAGGIGGALVNSDIDDIAMWNRILTDQEITALYSGNATAIVPSYVPKDGLVGYWPFNGNANDESGNSHNGTVYSANLTTDRFNQTNKAYSFYDPSYIDIGQWQNGGEFTFCSWVKVSSQNQSRSIVELSNGQYQNTLSMYFNDVNDFNFVNFANSGNGNCINNFNGGISLNNWYFTCATISSDSIVKLYVNAKMTKTAQCGRMPLNITRTKQYFGKNEFNEYFKGSLDDIAIYNRALTEQEITALYSGTPVTALTSTKVFVDAPATVNQNDTLELSISTEALNSSDNVIAYQTDFSYDTTRYTYVGNTLTGTLNPSGNTVVNTIKNGKLAISYMTQTALKGAGSIVKLKFKANATVGQGIFSLANFMYNNTDITALKSDTVNTIDVTPPTAKITFSQNPVRKGDSLRITIKFNEKMTDSPLPQLNLTGQNTLANSNLTKDNDTTYTYWWVVEKGNGAVNLQITSAKDLAGNALSKASSTATFTVLPTLFGDIDTNKFIRAFDAALALQYSVGLNPLPTMDPLPWSNWRIAVANVDTVGTITANDASLILQHSAKVIASFPADAKKRGDDAPVANITVTQESNQLVFRATGKLYAFNLFMKDNFNAFGQPEVKDKNAMVATNINTTTYNVGLASTTPFTENEPFLVIPMVTNEKVQGTMDIVANAQEKTLAYGAAASLSTIQNDALVVYPNPTKDVVTICNAQGKTVKIVDVQGKEVYNTVLPNTKTEISLKALGTRGIYVVHILDANNLPVQTKQIVLE